MQKYISLFLLLLLLFTTSCGKKEKPVEPNPEPEKPSISLNDTEFYEKDIITVNVSEGTLDNYTYLFDDEYAFKVNDDKSITCKRSGEHKITVVNTTDTSIFKEFNINIYSLNISVLPSSDVIQSGDKFLLNYTPTQYNKEQSISDFNITVNEDEIASVDGNVITTKSRGNLTITVTSKYNENVSRKVNVKVTDIEQDFLLRPDKELAQIKAGEQIEMFMSQYKNYKPSDFKWSSSNDEVARVTTYSDTEIKVTGVGNGRCSVQCYLPDNPDIYASYIINVDGVMENVDYVYRFIMTAYNENGTYEGKSKGADGQLHWNNRQKYGEWFGNNGQPWCATFVSWCWYHAGLSNELLLKYQGCNTGQEWCEEHGIWHLKKGFQPQSGDIIFYLSNGSSHTGIVAFADDKYVYTIEGNYGQHVGIWRVSLNDPRTTGYARPNYPTCERQKDLSWIKTKILNGRHLWTDVNGGSEI